MLPKAAAAHYLDNIFLFWARLWGGAFSCFLSVCKGLEVASFGCFGFFGLRFFVWGASFFSFGPDFKFLRFGVALVPTFLKAKKVAKKPSAYAASAKTARNSAVLNKLALAAHSLLFSASLPLERHFAFFVLAAQTVLSTDATFRAVS